MHDFELQTVALGSIHCGTLVAGVLGNLAEHLKDPGTDARTFARRLLQWVGRRSRDDGQKENAQALEASDVDQISDGEVEEFSRAFAEHNRWLVQVAVSERDAKGDHVVVFKDSADGVKRDGEGPNEYLLRAVRLHVEQQAKRFEEMVASLTGASSVFTKATNELLRKNVDLSDRLQQSIREAQRPVEVPRLPYIPENPLVETNRRLNRLLGHVEGMRDVGLQSAQLIKSMNDTAIQMQADSMRNAKVNEMYTRIAIAISAISFMVTAVFSVWSYFDSEDRDHEAEQALLEYRDATRALSESQRLDLQQALKTSQAQADQDRALLLKLIEQKALNAQQRPRR